MTERYQAYEPQNRNQMALLGRPKRYAKWYLDWCCESGGTTTTRELRAVARVGWWWHLLTCPTLFANNRALQCRLPDGSVPEDEAALVEAKLSLTESDAVRAWLRGEASEPCLDKEEPSD